MSAAPSTVARPGLLTDRLTVLALGGAVAAALGSLLPWGTVLGIDVGGGNDAALTFVMALTAVGATVAGHFTSHHKGFGIAAAVLGALIAAIAMFDGFDLLNTVVESNVDGLVGFGMGLPLTYLGGGALLAGGVASAVTDRSALLACVEGRESTR